eukprot:CAMPEP_0201171382 /NCGR_PEP_ID=MMETSP0851-20130426/87770_1 /ASSEMBLY_ACC=CAM_ASM_000631 /TAXON_ID=183588 /ORGANISM="Pseudo-nitzschia fraudulenta, Strain WWA7" /LENGTH=55 /DNA_ID=CAMNT_0047453653 /DNA_START=158 /DNA_END=325 /DNA_ORIENTATION=+
MNPLIAVLNPLGPECHTANKDILEEDQTAQYQQDWPDMLTANRLGKRVAECIDVQ